MPGTTVPQPGVMATKFSLTIDGVEIGQFFQLLEINSEVEPVEFQSGEVSKPAARRHPPTVRLKRGHSKDLGIFTWHEAVLSGMGAKAQKNASLTMYGADGKPVARYFLQSAWPSAIEISGLMSDTGQVLQETVTFTCETLQRVST